MFARISVDPEICDGKPCIKGTRIPVFMILELIEAEIGFDKIIEEYYPDITKRRYQGLCGKRYVEHLFSKTP